MKNSRGVSLIALIITIIVIIILAAIVMNASSDTINNAQYAGFAQEFGEYTDSFKIDAANVKSATGIRGQQINAAQQYFMAANGFQSIESPSGNSTKNTDQGVAGYAMPVGYVLTNTNVDDSHDKGAAPYILQKILNIGVVSGEGWNMAKMPTTGNVAPTGSDESAEVAYVIRDAKTTYSASSKENVQDGSATHEFYGDSNGKEYHFVTSNGQVFTLPGYPVPQTDGTIEYHIDTQNGHYYVVAGNSGKAPGNTEANKNVNGDYVTNTQPIQASYLKQTHGVDATTGFVINKTEGDDNVATQARRLTSNGTPKN
jgi:type II secretory pathway pseudopilin PulG